MLKHDYHFLLLCGFSFNDIKIWGITKEKIINLFKKKIVKQQGNAEGQGVWFDFNDVKEWLYDFKSKKN